MLLGCSLSLSLFLFLAYVNQFSACSSKECLKHVVTCISSVAHELHVPLTHYTFSENVNHLARCSAESGKGLGIFPDMGLGTFWFITT